MLGIIEPAENSSGGLSIAELTNSILPTLAQRAASIDDSDAFVGENYAFLKDIGLMRAGVPIELGGLGAEVPELAEMLKSIARVCGSTALAFSMHTHQVAIPAWRWRHQKVAAVEPLLKRVASEQVVLLSSGGSDWIGGSGKAVKVDGGYRITARKRFTSGAAAGNILMTGAVHEEESGVRSVVHFGVSMASPEVSIEDTWRTLGMRGTGSNDVIVENLFVPDGSVAFFRAAGQWHPVFQIIGTIAFPLIYAVYVGVAESARDIAVKMVRDKATSDYVIGLVGRMETSLRAAQIAHRWMLDVVGRNAPSAETINEIMIGRSLVARHAIEVTELAMEAAGGAAFYRDSGLERRFRDIQGARYHPMQPGAQAQYAGSLALGLPTENIF
ncbi:acyl-CoA dehydrogenase family protein [Sinorhizobium sp. RAC02]|uniref:acyl-CoA dehydrogenase family protein n=1 Tax=Sinorhizobium sp. RAC02 TaxID=1842534 RepID=UPI00083DE23C|nr:acyl-CoA dehydrogenase family protein [Sinorhizobium sp. RAC02]AOF93060.1 hypothetical protein BSY16_4642 [Sinorhizobium sp. RAC02]